MFAPACGSGVRCLHAAVRPVAKSPDGHLSSGVLSQAARCNEWLANTAAVCSRTGLDGASEEGNFWEHAVFTSPLNDGGVGDVHYLLILYFFGRSFPCQSFSLGLLLIPVFQPDNCPTCLVFDVPVSQRVVNKGGMERGAVTCACFDFIRIQSICLVLNCFVRDLF